MGWKSYGDPSFANHVMRYVKGSDKNVKPVNGSMDFYETVMKEALKYEGQPYAWGDSNPKLDLIVRALFSGLLRKLESLFLEHHKNNMGQQRK